MVRLASKHGSNVMTLAGPITEERVASTITAIETGRKYDRKRCYITRWNVATKRVYILYGKICGKDCSLAEGECDTCSCNFSDVSIPTLRAKEIDIR